MKKQMKLIAFVLAVLMLVIGCAPKTEEGAEQSAGESTGKHVKNLIIGTTAENNVFNIHSQKDAFGRLNYNALTQGNFVYRDKNNQLQPFFFKTFEI